MTYNDIIMDSAKLIVGGVIGTIFTTWYKDLKDKREERKNLFLRMIAAKSYVRIPQTLINDMNIIEVLFRNHKKVLEKYRLYYAELCVPVPQIDLERQMAIYWDLLRAMGDHVGYKHLDNKTLNSRYIPNQALDEQKQQEEYHAKSLRFLTVADQLYTLMINQINSNKQEPPKPE